MVILLHFVILVVNVAIGQSVTKAQSNRVLDIVQLSNKVPLYRTSLCMAMASIISAQLLNVKISESVDSWKD